MKTAKNLSHENSDRILQYSSVYSNTSDYSTVSKMLIQSNIIKKLRKTSTHVKARTSIY